MEIVVQDFSIIIGNYNHLNEYSTRGQGLYLSLTQVSHILTILNISEANRTVIINFHTSAVVEE